MSDPLLNAGFTRQQVADALEFCDNDRERALGWLKKQKKGGGKLQWSEALAEKMKTMPEGQLKQTFQRMLSYDNVPIKPKTFKNFCKNSFNLQRNEALVEQMWVEFEPLVRKAPPAAKPAPVEPAPVAATTKQDNSATKKRSRSDSEGDAKTGKKVKKAAKAQALAVLEGLSQEQLSALVAGIEAGVDLADELQKATEAHAGRDPEQKKEKKEKKEKKHKKQKKEKKTKTDK